MWRLDLLEVKFHNCPARFPHTKKLLNARNNEKLLKRLPTSVKDADNEILALKKEYFDKKYYGSYKKLEKEINKVVKTEISKLKQDKTKNQSTINFLESGENVKLLITSKLVKSLTTSILINKDLKLNPPNYISEDVREIILDKSNIANPSKFFIQFCQNDKNLNNYFSNLWNNKSIKSIISEIEWSFKIVRGNLTTQEKDARRKATGKEISDDEKEASIGDSEVSEDDDDEDHHEQEEEDMEELDTEGVYEKFAIYDKLVGDSDNEDEEQAPDLDPSINYNEVTDEEPSDESEEDEELDSDSSSDDGFFEQDESSKKSTKKEKKDYNLPQLASGYFSGGSDDEGEDVDNDKVVKDITTQRKNRRGQRARQKIWAQKYGREAKHVKSEIEKAASDRERRRLEYEERCRKREEKNNLAPTGSNTAPLGDRKVRNGVSPAPGPPSDTTKMHPSWEAKKLAEEKLKNVKFQGKKITFD
ncbi:hypothetical protein G9P44_004591 [Scheffersomyces stipitis]|nr:hypothetical protein G9P44_004591 [Scheffersomyces stipitis]